MDTAEMYEMFESFKATLVLCHWNQLAIVQVWQDYRMSKMLGVDFHYES